MTVNSVPQFVKNIDPLRGLTLADGRRLSLRWAADLRQFGQDALAMLQLTIDEAQQLLQAEPAIEGAMQSARASRTELKPCSLTSSDFRRMGADAFATWQHSRLARSESRKRKTAATCQRCAKLGAKCWQHRGPQ